MFLAIVQKFGLYGFPNFDHYFWKNENFHKNHHIFAIGLKKPKKLFFSKHLLRYLLSRKYRYQTIISGKNIKEKIGFQNCLFGLFKNLGLWNGDEFGTFFFSYVCLGKFTTKISYRLGEVVVCFFLWYFAQSKSFLASPKMLFTNIPSLSNSLKV